MSDLSRVEQLLRNALGEDIYEVTPQSRVEVLLVQLNELIEGMGGGSVSPEDIASAVSAYLDEHPEAITVQDGSLTDAKFTEALKLKSIKDYVTPQMFGALGDGVNDDTAAIQYALDHYKRVYLPQGTYNTTAPIYVNSDTEFWGDGELSIINNIGNGWQKNALCVGFENGLYEGFSNGECILATDPIAFTKVTDTEFTTDTDLSVNDVLFFCVGWGGTTTEEKSFEHNSTATIILSKNDNDYDVAHKIPDNAVLYCYKNVAETYESADMRLYVCNHARVHDLCVKHLPTGSGMYALWVNGCFNRIYNIKVIGNTALASNLCVNNWIENIVCECYSSACDIAELVYYTTVSNVLFNKSKLSSESVSNDFALGAGHSNYYCNIISSLSAPIALFFGGGLIERCIFYNSRINANGDLIVKSSKFLNSNGITIASTPLFNDNVVFFDSCVFYNTSNFIRGKNNICLAPSSYGNRNTYHKENYFSKLGQFFPNGSVTSLECTAVDYGCTWDIYGTGISVNGNTYSYVKVVFVATSVVARIFDNEGKIITTAPYSGVTILATSILYYTVTSDIP